MAEAFNADYPTLKVDVAEGITEDERICLFDNLHGYRGIAQNIFCGRR